VKKAKIVGKKTFTRAEIEASQATAKAAESAETVERGAEAVASLAHRANKGSYDQANRMVARMKARMKLPGKPATPAKQKKTKNSKPKASKKQASKQGKAEPAGAMQLENLDGFMAKAKRGAKENTSRADRDADPVNKQYIKDLKRQVKKAKIVGKKTFTRAEIEASQATAKAAESAETVERGAEAVASLAHRANKGSYDQANRMVARMKARMKLPGKPATPAKQKKTKNSKPKASKKQASKQGKAEPAGAMQLDEFDGFMAKAKRGAKEELELEMQSTTNALTGHMSLAAVPASQLQKLTELANAELKRRQLESSTQPEVATDPESTVLTEQAAPMQLVVEHKDTKRAIPKKSTHAGATVDGMPSTDNMAEMIKRSVAKALGNTYDEEVVTSALLQEN